MFLRNTGSCPPNNKTPRHIRTQSPRGTSFTTFNLRNYNCRPKTVKVCLYPHSPLTIKKHSLSFKLIKRPSKAYYKKFTSDINSLFNIMCFQGGINAGRLTFELLFNNISHSMHYDSGASMKTNH